MGYKTVDVEIDLEDFSDEELLEEIANRGVGPDTVETALDGMPVWLRKEVERYLCTRVVVQSDLDAWKVSCEGALK